MALGAKLDRSVGTAYSVWNPGVLVIPFQISMSVFGLTTGRLHATIESGQLSALQTTVEDMRMSVARFRLQSSPHPARST